MQSFACSQIRLEPLVLWLVLMLQSTVLQPVVQCCRSIVLVTVLGSLLLMELCFPFYLWTPGCEEWKVFWFWGTPSLLCFLVLEHGKGNIIFFSWYICLLSVTGSIGVEENGSTFPEWTSRRSWKDRQKTKKANANGPQHLLATSEPELIYYGKHSGLVGLCKSDVFCPSVDDEACASGYDKVFRYILIAY